MAGPAFLLTSSQSLAGLSDTSPSSSEDSCAHSEVREREACVNGDALSRCVGLS